MAKKKYTVQMTFWGTIKATSQEDAFNKAYEGLSDSCGNFEDAMLNLGMTDVEHNHDEPEEEEE